MFIILKKKKMELETEEKIKYWNDIEISDEGKYPLWFLECEKRCCSLLRNNLNIKGKVKEKGSKDKDGKENIEGEGVRVEDQVPYTPSPGFKIDW